MLSLLVALREGRLFELLLSWAVVTVRHKTNAKSQARRKAIGVRHASRSAGVSRGRRRTAAETLFRARPGKADDLAVPHRLPNDPTIRVNKDAVAVRRRDAGRHCRRSASRQAPGSRYWPASVLITADRGPRLKLPMNTALRSKTMALVCTWGWLCI